MAINVLGETQLENLGVNGLEDFAKMFPNVAFTTNGPNDGAIFIRGIGSQTNGNIGPLPNTAIYLDEQNVTVVNAFLNPHIYDIARIETLAGPQGTLFGANAQSGAVRIITNKPDPSQFEAGFNVEVNSVTEGGTGYLGEGFVNIPISDNAALRVVGWYKEEAGYIDNELETWTFDLSSIRNSLTDPALIALAQDVTIDNAELVEKNQNEATTAGLRAALRIDLNDNWTLTAGVMRQELDSEGIFTHEPGTAGDLKVTGQTPEFKDDKWTQLSLTVEGRIGDMTLTYAGADIDRDLYNQLDYTLYADYDLRGGYTWQRFYTCYVEYFAVCEDPSSSFRNDSSWNRMTHELRLASADDQRLRWLVGAFYEDGEGIQNADWTMVPALWDVRGNGSMGGSPQDGPTAPLVLEGDDVWFTTQFDRPSEEWAVFGEIAFDITDSLTVAASTRYFDHTTGMEGFSGTFWWPSRFGSILPDEINYVAETSDSDTVSKVSATYAVNDDVIVYGSWSEGYRPGGVNRVFHESTSFDYKPDFVESFELGLKSTLLDGRLNLNLAAFTMDWVDIQFSYLDIAVQPLFLTSNTGKASSDGFEGDFAFLITPDWDIRGGFAYTDAKLAEDYWFVATDEGDGNPDVPKGRQLPKTADLKWNLSTRYKFNAFNRPAFVQASYVYNGEVYSTLFDSSNPIQARRKQDSYGILDASIGIEEEAWRAELFVRNLTDERGQLFYDTFTWDVRIATNQPRTAGLRYSMKF